MFPKLSASKKTIYMDYAAATPLAPEVKIAMQPFWDVQFGNPSSLYKLGMQAAAAVSSARSTIAGILGAGAQEIIFTAGGTESINLAIFGVARSVKKQ